MTKQEYAQYEQSVADFMAFEELEIATTDSDESFFSWAPCECCKRPLAGERYVAWGAMRGEDGKLKPAEETWNVCPDCVHYFTYGRLDDETMRDLV